MPEYLLFAVFIEIALVAFSCILLCQPRFFFHEREGVSGFRPGASFFGLIFFCLTFIWSVALGVMIALSDMKWELVL